MLFKLGNISRFYLKKAQKGHMYNVRISQYKSGGGREIHIDPVSEKVLFPNLFKGIGENICSV